MWWGVLTILRGPGLDETSHTEVEDLYATGKSN